MSFSTTFLPYTVPLSTAACIAFSLQSIFANCQLPTFSPIFTCLFHAIPMGNISQSLRRIPIWAYLLVLLVIFVNTVYFIYRDLAKVSGETTTFANGHWIIDYIGEDTPVSRTEIKIGDTLVSCNGYPLEEWYSCYHWQEVGDTLLFGIIRNNLEVGIPVIVGSIHSQAPGFFWFIYVALLIFSIASLYILYKKPADDSVILFFISIQLIMISANALYIEFQDPIAMIALLAFMLSGCFIGPLLVHFHLLFPRPAKFLNRYNRLPVLIYILGLLIFIGHAVTYSYFIYTGNTLGPFFELFNRIVVLWMTVTFTLALLIAIFELRITNYPNPVYQSTTFSYTLKEPAQVTLQVYDSFGQLIDEPVHTYQQQGEQQINWNAEGYPSGIYFYRVQAGNEAGSGKMNKL